MAYVGFALTMLFVIIMGALFVTIPWSIWQVERAEAACSRGDHTWCKHAPPWQGS